MAIKSKAVIPALVLAGLALAMGSGSGSRPRTIAELDLTLPAAALAAMVDGGSDADHLFPARARAATTPSPWRNAGPSLEDLPAGPAPLLPYAGVGWGPFRLAMDLMTLDLELDKDRSTRRARAFAGIGYQPTPALTLFLEYRSLAQGDPLFALGLGNLDLALGAPFGSQSVIVKLRYRM